MTPGELRQWANAHANEGSGSYSPVAKAVLDLFASHDLLLIEAEKWMEAKQEADQVPEPAPEAKGE